MPPRPLDGPHVGEHVAGAMSVPGGLFALGFTLCTPATGTLHVPRMACAELLVQLVVDDEHGRVGGDGLADLLDRARPRRRRCAGTPVRRSFR